MVPKVLISTWVERKHEIEQIRSDLREKYPTLHIFINRGGFAEIAGSFPVRGANGEVLDSYSVSIILPNKYPNQLPVVYEVGGRIPRKPDYHINPDGSACVIIPDDRWRCFPVDAPFIAYISGPLHNFFLSQTYFAETGEWPFGQWEHGIKGIHEYYRWLIDVEDNLTVCRFLHILTKNNLKKHYECPCASGKTIRHCCLNKVRDLRHKVSIEMAVRARQQLCHSQMLYKRSHLR
jgi:hypothetical protein